MHNNFPKISVITPTYNAKPLMEDCVLSVASQTYPHIEHLVIDACSTDGTQELLAGLADQYGHLHWISEPDDGIYNAMNKGIRMAEGEWLYFLGSDDVLKNHDVLTTIFTRDDTASNDIIYGYNEFGDRNQTFGREFSLANLVLQNICHQAIFYRKELFAKYGCYNEAYRSWSDWEMNVRLFANDNITVTYLPVIISKYATGGYSALHRDEKLLEDLPEIIRKYIAPKHAGAYIELLEQKKIIEWQQQQCRSKDDELQRRATVIDDLSQSLSSQNEALKPVIDSHQGYLSMMKSSKIWKIWKQYLKIR
jgi:glycosyltransferase involved in cell wall biosynthesis